MCIVCAFLVCVQYAYPRQNVYLHTHVQVGAYARMLKR